MHVMPRLPRLAGLLLLAAAPWAAAETPMTDPIPPAVIGRPLDQIRPARTVRPRPAAVKPKRPKPLATASRRAKKPAAPVAVARTAPAGQAALAAPTQRAPKQAVDDRAGPATSIPNDVGKGANFARKPLGPGAYFSSRHQAMVRKYYETKPVSGRPGRWKIGEPVPPKTAMTGVPDELRAALPRVPPGHQYVQLDGEVVLVALPSRMVVDGISRGVR